MAKRQKEKKVGLAPLDFEAAIRATLATGKAPPLPKKAKRKAKK